MTSSAMWKPCNVGLYKVTRNSALTMDCASCSLDFCGSKANITSSKSSTCLMDGTNPVGVPFHRKRKLQLSVRFELKGKLRASIIENVPMRPTSLLEQANEEKLVFLEPTWLSTVLFPTKRSTFQGRKDRIQDLIQMGVYNCRFFTFVGVAGTLVGSILCFLTGCNFIWESISQYFHAIWKGADFSQIILPLFEAIDVYLMGTVMLIFGMGLYKLFISNLHNTAQREHSRASSLFGLFGLKERPLWLDIESVEELKTKIGHVIIMTLLVGLFEKSKRVPITTGLDLLCFSATILLSSASIFLLSKLSGK